MSIPFKIGTMGPHAVLPLSISCPIIFSWISSMVWNLFPFKGDFSFGKSQNNRPPNLGCRGAESPWWFDVSPKIYGQDIMHEWSCCHGEAVNHQLSIAKDFCIIRIVSTEECSSLMQNLMEICCSTQSFWMQWPHSTHAHSVASTTPTD